MTLDDFRPTAAPISRQVEGLAHLGELGRMVGALGAAHLDQLATRNAAFQERMTRLLRTDAHPGPGDAIAYATDWLQRSILFWDTLRQRGNRFITHFQAGSPPVLVFDYDTVVDGRKLQRPVNYALVRIRPPAGVTIDPVKRPFMIVDPRAGHGSGIGGFKDESQVGVALRAGHPVYFVIFFPMPEPGQLLRDVAAAEAEFLREIARLHPQSPKPCVIGNCQGGWAVMGLSALHPDLVGPLVINGAPLSYWAGEDGKNPMRYTGGMLGGTWMAQLASDIGAGKFDGALLVRNFEELNPSNTYWTKYYSLFTKIDTEAARFLEFERWWGGFYLMNGEEIRAIVEDLFVGNKLAGGSIGADRGHAIDLRKIRSPIIVFCSDGDNITPPQQALNWIADLYPDTRAIRTAGQTIVFLRHHSIGHLGIFVSGAIARKEYTEIVDTVGVIERLPPGLYEMKINDRGERPDGGPRYEVILEEREVADIRGPDPSGHADERKFQMVKAISDLNGSAYDLLVSPAIRATATEPAAAAMRLAHPLRASRYLISDCNPLFWGLPAMAEGVRAARRPVRADNPYLKMQQAWSEGVVFALDTYRDLRDASVEIWFHAAYGMLSQWVGQPEAASPAEDSEAERDATIADSVRATIDKGGFADAVIRMILMLVDARGYIRRDGIARTYDLLRANDAFAGLTADDLKLRVHAQTAIIAYAPDQALTTLAVLLPTAEERRRAIETVDGLVGPADRADARVAATLGRLVEVLALRPAPVERSGSEAAE